MRNLWKALLRNLEGLKRGPEVSINRESDSLTVGGYSFARATITNWVAYTTKTVVSQFWRLDIQKQVVGRLVPSEGLRSGSVLDLSSWHGTASSS